MNTFIQVFDISLCISIYQLNPYLHVVYLPHAVADFSKVSTLSRLFKIFKTISHLHVLYIVKVYVKVMPCRAFLAHNSTAHTMIV